MSRRKVVRSNGAVKLYREFHGRYPREAGVKTFHAPRHLIHLGRAVAIVYETDKLHGGGDGKMAEYIHEFETPVGVFMDETGKKQLYILGHALKITNRGIEN